MTAQSIKEVVAEAERLLSRIHELENTDEFQASHRARTYVLGCKESGAVRRSSLDLTRALAKMRSRE